MTFGSPLRRALAGIVALACCGVVAAVVATGGMARSAGQELVLTQGKASGAMLDVAPMGRAKGVVSLGDEFVVASPVRASGGVRGTFQAVYVSGDPRPVPASRSRGLITGVFHLSDGDLYVSAESTFDDSDVDHGIVVGGTGRYAGASGTITAGHTRTVVRLAS